jgi:hypothetical protein
MGQEQQDAELPFDSSEEQQEQGSQRGGRRQQRRMSSEQFGGQKLSPRPQDPVPQHDRVQEMLRHRCETGSTPFVAKLTNVTLDESTFGVLVRIDEVLRWRQQLGDKTTLDRIEEIYVSRFRDFLS